MHSAEECKLILTLLLLSKAIVFIALVSSSPNVMPSFCSWKNERDLLVSSLISVQGNIWHKQTFDFIATVVAARPLWIFNVAIFFKWSGQAFMINHKFRGWYRKMPRMTGKSVKYWIRIWIWIQYYIICGIPILIKKKYLHAAFYDMIWLASWHRMSMYRNNRFFMKDYNHFMSQMAPRMMKA